MPKGLPHPPTDESEATQAIAPSITPPDAMLASGGVVTSPDTPDSVEREILGPSPVSPGQILYRRYQVERQLGEGGMGSVWLVRHLELEKRRALKLIMSGIASDPKARARFRREAKLAAQLDHPNAVTVHDARVGGDAAYIEMEYIPGTSLASRLEAGKPLPLDLVTRLLDQLCDVVQAAHDLGIVHRDLKPSNLMLVEGRKPGHEQLKVVDFGIAKIFDPERRTEEDNVTRSGGASFTPPYASPEQIGTSEVDGRSDLYNIGVILYEMLTGYRPFTGGNLAYQHLCVPPPPFAIRNPAASAPTEVERVVMWCLEKEPEKRPQTALELNEAFHAALLASGYTVPPLSGSTTSQPVLKSGPPAPTERDGAGVATETDRLTPRSRPEGLPTERGTTTRSGASTTGSHDTLLAPRPSRRRVWIASATLVATAALASWVMVIYSHRHPPIKPEDPSKHDPQKIEEQVLTPLSPRLIDGRTFYLWKNGRYLPEGYEPKDPLEVGKDGWPTTIRRAKDKVEFVRIPGGRFEMGAREGAPDDFNDNKPAHEVVLAGFYMQVFEVTNAEIDAYSRQSAAHGTQLTRWSEQYQVVKAARGVSDPQAHPATQVTWVIADQFARSQQAYLPTEAQWEWAARSANPARKLIWAPELDSKPVAELAVNLNRDPYGEVQTTRVGANSDDCTVQGVMDMAGNVREWCRDVARPYTPASRKDPDPDLLPDLKSLDADVVVRGGSYISLTEPKYASYRGTKQHISDDEVPKDIGFRLVIQCPEPNSAVAERGGP